MTPDLQFLFLNREILYLGYLSVIFRFVSRNRRSKRHAGRRSGRHASQVVGPMRVRLYSCGQHASPVSPAQAVLGTFGVLGGGLSVAAAAVGFVVVAVLGGHTLGSGLAASPPSALAGRSVPGACASARHGGHRRGCATHHARRPTASRAAPHDGAPPVTPPPAIVPGTGTGTLGGDTPAARPTRRPRPVAAAPAPSVVPDPGGTPSPSTAPTPTPAPSLTPSPTPTSRPSPAPIPAPTLPGGRGRPSPAPAPVPTVVPDPPVTPAPAPTPTGEPTRKPKPSPAPTANPGGPAVAPRLPVPVSAAALWRPRRAALTAAAARDSRRPV